ncbi:MAG: hypothetical protein KKF28_05405, partial [Proteobacteria bacterium]|nr:hypothetical protein [Pseudomonadota bacterium]
YGYPIEEATQIAVSTVRDFLKENTTSTEVIFCCFSEHDLSVYKRYVACNSEALTEGRDIWE